MPPFDVTVSWYEWRTIRVVADTEDEAIANHSDGNIIAEDSSDYEVIDIKEVTV